MIWQVIGLAKVGSPAHAGIDRGAIRHRRRCIRFPRPRGDRPSKMMSPRVRNAVPPPTRG